MSSLKSETGRTRAVRLGSPWLVGFVGASLLVFTTGCPLVVDDPTSENGMVKGGGSSALSRLPNVPERGVECEPYVLAIVIPQNHWISDLEVLVEGTPAPVDLDISPTYQNLLLDHLVGCSQGGFDPAIQDFFTASFSKPDPCSLDFSFEFSFFLFDEFDAPKDMDRLIAGGALESDLLDGSPLTTFDCIDSPVEVLTVPPVSGVPAMSLWGLVMLTLLLMAGGKAYYGRRGTAAVR